MVVVDPHVRGKVKGSRIQDELTKLVVAEELQDAVAWEVLGNAVEKVRDHS